MNGCHVRRSLVLSWSHYCGGCENCNYKHIRGIHLLRKTPMQDNHFAKEQGREV